MKLLKTILVIAVHGAQASHKVTTNAVEAETTQRLAVEAATAGVVNAPRSSDRSASTATANARIYGTIMTIASELK